MVDMGVRQQHGADRAGIEWKGVVVQLLQRLVALEHAAIDQQPAPGVLKQIAGAGNRSSRAEECERRRRGARAEASSSAMLAAFEPCGTLSLLRTRRPAS